MNNPTFTIIAGVNGSGKTTFALDYFKNSNIQFINADSIATALSPNNPDISQFKAGKLMLAEVRKCIKDKKNFAIETTLASKNYLKVIKELKQDGWEVELLYLYLPNIELSVQRVAERVKNGGHNIKIIDIKRRYNRSISNLVNVYIDVVNNITCLSNFNQVVDVFSKNNGELIINNQKIYNNILRYKNAE